LIVIRSRLRLALDRRWQFGQSSIRFSKPVVIANCVGMMEIERNRPAEQVAASQCSTAPGA
jgi:hypothetical protein